MRTFSSFLLILIALLPVVVSAQELDLVQAPDDFVKYKLSNLRVETGISGDEYIFDYKRTREGQGHPRVVVRTDRGVSRILGVPIRIESAGTIRLRDMFSRTRGILNGGREDGIEFLFVADSEIGFGSRKQFLVSNTVRHGALVTRVKARPLNDKELAEIEMQRKSKLPPETVPEGYVRGSADTTLVPGARIMYGSIGAWKPGTFMALKRSDLARIKPDESNRIIDLPIKDWIAVSEETLQQIQSNPSQFSVDFQTLPDGNLVLDEGVEPLQSAMKLAKGTPLLREKHGRWENVHLISSDNVSVRALVRDSSGPKVEFIPLKELAIREQTLADQQDNAARKAFAANVADFENQIAPLSGNTAAMATGGLANVGTLAPSTSNPPPASAVPEPDPVPTRSWTDKSGRFKIEARLVKQEDGQVFLRRTDGRTVAVPLDKLSEADQTYLKEEMTAADNPFDNVVESPAASGSVDYSRIMQPITTVGDLSWGAKSVAISPDNRLLLIGRKAASASLVDVKTGQMLVDSGRMEHMGDIGVCGFTADGRSMLMGGGKGVFEVYALGSDGKLELKGQHALHNSEITSLAISRDGRFALSGDTDKTARYWSIESGEPIATITGFDGKIKATCITPLGDYLLATDGKTLLSYSTTDEKVVGKLEVGRSHSSGQAAAFSADGETLAVGDGYKIDLWDLTQRRKTGTLEGKEINWSMTFAPDNRHLLSGGNGTIYVWDCDQNVKRQTNRIGQSFYVQAVCVSPDGTLVASPSDHSSVTVLQAGQ